MMIIIKKIMRTCSACPSQWEGITIDGNQLYIRYRYGCLSVRISEDKTKDIMKAIRGREILCENIGGIWDGTLDYEELKKYTKHVLKLPEEECWEEKYYIANELGY